MSRLSDGVHESIPIHRIVTLILIATASTACVSQRYPEADSGTAEYDEDFTGYTVQNLLTHSSERLLQEFLSAYKIRIVHPKVFGFNEDEAIVYANFYVITERRYEHIPQIYPLLLRTVDGGHTWTQDLDPVKHRVSDIEEVRFIDEKTGWFVWQHNIAGSSFGMFQTQNGGLTWREIIPWTQGLLTAWSFTSPWDGACVVDSPSGVPFASDEARDDGCWVVGTTDGGRNWEITQSIKRGTTEWRSAEQALPPTQWVEPSTHWAVEDEQDFFSVRRRNETGQWNEVLVLPRTCFNTDP